MARSYQDGEHRSGGIYDGRDGALGAALIALQRSFGILPAAGLTNMEPAK